MSAHNERDGFLGGWAGEFVDGAGHLEEAHLAAADPCLGAVISRVIAVEGPRRYRASNAASHFDALARSIIYQQLSKKSAATIYARYREALGGSAEPGAVAMTDDGALRSAGLSAPKVKYIKGLASSVVAGYLDLDRMHERTDSEIIALLTEVPGIGVWTAQMFLMFRLRRPDVLPTHDLGIRRGLQIAHRLKKPAAPGYILRAGARWAPYRSLACLYLWAGLDLQIDPSVLGEEIGRRGRKS